MLLFKCHSPVQQEHETRTIILNQFFGDWGPVHGLVPVYVRNSEFWSLELAGFLGMPELQNIFLDQNSGNSVEMTRHDVCNNWVQSCSRCSLMSTSECSNATLFRGSSGQHFQRWAII